MRAKNPFRGRPTSAEYDGIDTHRARLDGMTAGELMRHDAQVWENTGSHGVGKPDSHKSDIVGNLFKVVRYAGLMCSPDPKGERYTPWKYNIATCLSHGGRVLIQIPKVSPLDGKPMDHSFWEWFRGESPLRKRVGTHSVGRNGSKYAPLPNDRLKYVKEKGGLKHGLAQWIEQRMATSGFERAHNMNVEGSYGMNIAFGGYGQKSEARGRTIQDDGTFGHLYIFYIPPTHSECGAILIGLEGDAPGKWGETGNFHSYNIGWVDKLRSSKPNKDMGLVTGPKWEAIGEKFHQVSPAKKSGMFVDCTAIGVGILKTQPFKWKMVHEPTKPLALNFPAVELALPAHMDLFRFRDVYKVIPVNQCQARLDALAEYRKAAKKLGQPTDAVDNAITTLIAARETAA
jgi:hypothetical protein